MNALIYDIEIRNCIPPRDGERDPHLTYCEGWHDFRGMGVAVVGVWDCMENVPLVYFENDLEEFAALAERRALLISFNGIKFDNHLLDAHGVELPRRKCFDILRELWIADGLNPDEFNQATHGGYGLDNYCKANFGIGKSGNGADAPVKWQRGFHGEVVSYCLRDVMLTRRLFMRAVNQGAIVHPKRAPELISLKAMPTLI